MLSRLAALTGQPGDAADMEYFLSSPKALKKTPYLLLTKAYANEPSVEGYSEAVLLFEYRVSIGATRVFATSDPSGRRNLFAAPAERATLAARAVRTLLQSGAHIVHIAYHKGDLELPSESLSETEQVAVAFGDPSPDAALRRSQRMAGKRDWSLVEQIIPSYLPIEPTFDETIARLGHLTRRNLRYYRRRTEKEIGCVFVPEVQIGLDDFLAFSRACTYAVPDEIAAWRYRALSLIETPFLCGVHDSSGRWLSMIGGRRSRTVTEIDWQMNLDGLEKYSLTTVARACMIEHEASLGSTRLYLEGGTPHSITNQFVRETVVELTAKRRSLYTHLLTRFAPRVFPPDNYVGQILRDASYSWHLW
ncbi:hypothetical protein HDF17_002087 [Granulicella arctica]|uniref:BioF2-like acetyltransferase domain-containing protein n=2 Tax=Granulicella arctica TaxID=940613 RepID=A0A7Y9TL33_9BACT|nr:hypothetical protein [Granulicella arctica]